MVTSTTFRIRFRSKSIHFLRMGTVRGAFVQRRVKVIVVVLHEAVLLVGLRLGATLPPLRARSKFPGPRRRLLPPLRLLRRRLLPSVFLPPYLENRSAAAKSAGSESGRVEDNVVAADAAVDFSEIVLCPRRRLPSPSVG